MSKNECGLCYVAYDVDKNYCDERDCLRKMVAALQPKDLRLAKARINPSTVKSGYARKPKDRDRVRERFVSCRSRARKRGLGFDLTEDFVSELLTMSCTYCNASENIQIDRKNNSLGYLRANVVPACKRCNTVKSMYLSYEQMIAVAAVLGWKQ